MNGCELLVSAALDALRLCREAIDDGVHPLLINRWWWWIVPMSPEAAMARICRKYRGD